MRRTRPLCRAEPGPRWRSPEKETPRSTDGQAGETVARPFLALTAVAETNADDRRLPSLARHMNRERGAKKWQPTHGCEARAVAVEVAEARSRRQDGT